MLNLLWNLLLGYCYIQKRLSIDEVDGIMVGVDCGALGCGQYPV